MSWSRVRKLEIVEVKCQEQEQGEEVRK